MIPDGAPAVEITHLTRALVRGDEGAWVRVYESYNGRIFRYALVLLHGDEAAAWEVVQTTFTRMARNIRPFSDEHVFWHWIARIARTAIIDDLRKSNRHESLLGEMERNLPETPDSDAPWLELLDRALAQLDDEYRVILTEKYFSGASIREIAATLSLSEKAAESRLTRARQKLRETMLVLLNHEPKK